MQQVIENRERQLAMQNSKKTNVAPKDNGSGWDYWMRVYNEDKFRGNAPNQVVRDMQISDMLTSESLVRAKLLFLNVPGLPTGYKNIILHLLKRELNENIPIQDVIVQPGKWFLNFYRPEDALRVLRAFNGYNYRNHTLIVRFCYPDGTFGDENALDELVACTSHNKAQLLVHNNIVQEISNEGVWSPTELEAVKIFEKELINILKTNSFLPYHTAITSVRNVLVNKNISSYFIIDALGQWSTGFIRIFHHSVKVIANTVCLATGNYYTQKIRDSAREGVCSSQRDSWEPCVPEDIRNDVQLKQYVYAFLYHFGPQHIHIDIPLRILAQSLRGVWPKTGHELAHLMTTISAGFVIINDVLYLAAHERHNDHIIDNLAAYQDDSDETLAVPSSFDHKPVSVVDLDFL